MAKGTTFKFDSSALSRFGDRLGKGFARDDKELERRVKRATDIIWRTAHAKRPMMSKAQMKAEGRRIRVSDPGAQAGVPVRTGKLQASIRQSTSSKGLMRYQGVIETTGIPYAGYMEYGTRHVAARPFMRPAVALNHEVVKRVFGVQVSSTL